MDSGRIVASTVITCRSLKEFKRGKINSFQPSLMTLHLAALLRPAIPMVLASTSQIPESLGCFNRSIYASILCPRIVPFAVAARVIRGTILSDKYEERCPVVISQ